MSATTSPAALPTPEPDEPSDVTVAIEAARALWENGDREEALRWFSRAAEAAEQGGNDRRALELARAVADLKDGLAASAVPPAAPAAPASSPAAPSAPVPPPLPTAAAPGPPPASTAPKFVTRPPPPPSARKSVAPTPPSMRPRSPEATTAKSFSGPETADAAKAPEPMPPAPAAPAVKSVAPAVKSVAPVVKPVAPVVKPVAAETRSDGVDAERIRVSVKSSARDPNLLLVRILGAGQSVPSGCHEAFLSPAQSGIDLRSPGE
jgi:hypothetical protein